MKVKIVSRDKTITVRNNEAFVTWMRKNDSQQLKENEEFMLAYAKRKELYDKKTIRTSNVGDFVNDLKQNGYIELYD